MCSQFFEQSTPFIDAWQLFLDDSSFSALEKRCYAWLSIDELARREEFRMGRPRDVYQAARMFCRATLSRYADVYPTVWRFTTGAHGKPRIVAPTQCKSLRFNLTHTKGLMICVVSRVNEVGVDAEEIPCSYDFVRLSSQMFSPRERALLQNVPEQERSARCLERWVVKEAYFKGTGRGLTGAPERLTMEFGKNGMPLPIGNWQLFLHRPDSTHVAAAAVRTHQTLEAPSVRWLTVADLP